MDKILYSGNNYLTMKNIDKIFDDVKKQEDAYNRELLKRSKPKEELVVSIDCLVESVTGYVLQTEFHVQSERVFGGKSPSYSGGDSSHLEIRVKTDTATNKLVSRGLLPIQKGDTIRAYILKGEEEYERNIQALHTHNRRSHWVERNFSEEEKPFKIEKLVNDEVVATYFV